MGKVMMISETLVQLPRIDFSSLDSNKPYGYAWNTARTEVMRALESFGCFDVVYDSVTPEVRKKLFSHCMQEVFALPLETKQLNVSDGPYGGFMIKKSYESLRISHAPTLKSVEDFARLMWPEDNPTLSNTVWSFAKQMEDLERIVRRMIFQGLGVEKYYDSHIESTVYGLALSKYWNPSDPKIPTGMEAHKDLNMLTIICQDQVEGLEVQTKDGEWIRVIPSSNTSTVILGEIFEAWSNGRLKPPLHRVRMIGDETRYATLFGPRMKKGFTVQVPEELIDDEYPLRFEPFDYEEYITSNCRKSGPWLHYADFYDALMANNVE